MHVQSLQRCSCVTGVSELHTRRPPQSRCIAVRSTPGGTLIGKPKLKFAGPVRASEGMSLTKPTWTAQLDQRLTAPGISKTDAHFVQLGLEFVEGQEGIVTSDLNALFEKVGFPRRDPERLAVALDNTHRILWIKCIKQTRYARVGELVGFARATSDGVFSATIWDVAVAPVWQRSGLGRALMERLTKQLVEDGISTITLYAEPKVVGLYRKLGFVDDPEGVKGMAFQRKKRNQQSMRAVLAQAA